MTIEMKIPFLEKDEALDFQRYLKKNGCPSRIETSLDINQDVVYSATIGAIEAFLDSVEQRDQGNPDRWNEEKRAVESARKWIAGFRENIAVFYEKCEVGVAYPRDEFMPTMNGLNISFLDRDIGGIDADEIERQEKMIGKAAQMFGAMLSLEYNGCLTLDSAASSVTLTQKKPIEDLEVESLRHIIFGMFEPEELIKAGITFSMHTYVTNQYTVTAGPESIMLDTEDLIEYIRDTYDRDEDEDEEVFFHIRMCTMLVQNIMVILADRPATAAELIDLLFENDSEMQITFDVLTEAMDSILADMKKLGLITIRNGTVKLAK